ncbi:MAG: imidazole glycerol phosphate synthase cyclase subunit [Candidatus Micrarchaeia archaeon]
MLKTRIIPSILIKNNIVVKSKRFAEWRNIGSCMNVARVYESREVDELVILDIPATPEGRKPALALMRQIADECFMPLAMGGGVRSLDDVRDLLNAGADKVVVNTRALENPLFVTEIADVYGAQCVVASIDARRTADGHGVYSHCGAKATGLKPVEWAKRLEELGAGEILLTSIDEDGMMAGYDLALVESVAKAVCIPVIAAGGAGSPDDVVRVIREGKADAASVASLFLYTQFTPNNVKQAMREAGIEVRL